MFKVLLLRVRIVKGFGIKSAFLEFCLIFLDLRNLVYKRDVGYS